MFNSKWLWFGSLVVVLAVAGVVVWPRFFSQPERGCTLEAKICPDGTAVGRSGPNCEFAACPIPEAWKTFSDPARGLSFRYPEKLPTEYIRVFDWPPQVQILNEKFSCTEAGLETGRAGRTEKRTIDGRTYCVTQVSEGAAGSIYDQYAYVVEKSGKTVALTFTTRSVQCGNYDEPQKTACEKERQEFSINETINQIFETLTLGG